MELVQNFLEPAYMLILFGIVEVLKYLGAFKALESFQFYEELNEDFSKDAKRLFILFIGIVLMLIFLFTRFDTVWNYEGLNYLAKLIVSFALTVTCYEMLLKHIKNRMIKIFSKKK